MPVVRYIGPCADGVEIADTAQYVPHGGEVEVTDELAAGLLGQVDNWRPVTKKTAKAEKE